MKKKILLTSLLGLTIACPSFAAVDIAKNAEDPGCTNSVLKTYDGSAALEADYTANTINLNFYSDENTVYSTGTCTYDGGIELPEEDPTRTGYTFDGWQVRRAAAAPTLNLSSIIGTDAGESYAYVNGSGSFSERNYDGQGAKGQSYYGITANNTWAVDYGSTKGMLIGTGRCSSEPGNNSSYAWTYPTILTTSEMGAEGGRYCYCNVTGYTKNGTLQSVSSPWVFFDGSLDSDCASYCALRCAAYMLRGDGLAFRAAVFGSVQ